MSLGEKIAEAMPESWVQYISEHPRVVYFVTVPLVLLATYNLERAWHLQTTAEMFVKQHAADAARAASEALGG